MLWKIDCDFRGLPLQNNPFCCCECGPGYSLVFDSDELIVRLIGRLVPTIEVSPRVDQIVLVDYATLLKNPLREITFENSDFRRSSKPQAVDDLRPKVEAIPCISRSRLDYTGDFHSSELLVRKIDEHALRYVACGLQPKLSSRASISRSGLYQRGYGNLDQLRVSG